MNCEMVNFLKMRCAEAKGNVPKCIRTRFDGNFKFMMALNVKKVKICETGKK